MGLLRRGRPRDEGGDHGGHDGGAAGPRVRVLSREGCHLCEQALEVVAAVCTELGEAWEVVDVDADPALLAGSPGATGDALLPRRPFPSW